MNEPRLYLFQLGQEIAQLGDEITNHRKVAQGLDPNLASLLRVVGEKRGTSKLGLAIHHHAATTAYPHTARPPVSERAVLGVLDMVQGIEHDPFLMDRYLEALEVRL